MNGSGTGSLLLGRKPSRRQNERRWDGWKESRESFPFLHIPISAGREEKQQFSHPSPSSFIRILILSPPTSAIRLSPPSFDVKERAHTNGYTSPSPIIILPNSKNILCRTPPLQNVGGEYWSLESSTWRHAEDSSSQPIRSKFQLCMRGQLLVMTRPGELVSRKWRSHNVGNSFLMKRI